MSTKYPEKDKRFFRKTKRVGAGPDCYEFDKDTLIDGKYV